MMNQNEIDYYRVAKAIEYINANFKNQPDLEKIAAEVNLSPFHFQKLFTRWAGVSPKKFIQYMSINYAKDCLKEKQATLFDAANEIGFSSTSRLHDLFINIEGMTPGEFKNGGEKLTICYSTSVSPFGNVLLASTEKGICHLSFFEDKTEALEILKSKFPKAIYQCEKKVFHEQAISFFDLEWENKKTIQLHLAGTPFQLKVWEALLKILFGDLTTYGDLASKINNPTASRAVGTAIGSNPIAYLIPCHRVIQSSGKLGGYMWHPTRKTAIIGWEASRLTKTSKPSFI